MNKSAFFRSYRYYWSFYSRLWLTWGVVVLIDLLTASLFLFSGSTQIFGTLALVSLLLLPVLSIRAETPQVSFEDTFPVPPAARISGEVCALESFYLISLFLTIPLLLLAGRLNLVETAPSITSYGALILYGLCIISFCIWVSRFFSNTVFSYLITASLLFFCNTVHLLPLDAAWIKSISFIWHFDSAAKGIVATKDLVFFIAVSAFCVAASVECSQFRKNRKNRRPLLNLALELLLFLLVAGNARLFNLRFDTTSDKRYSLCPESVAIVEQVQEPLHITWYVSKTILNRYPQVEDMRYLLNQYAAVNPLISVSVVSDPDRIAESSLGTLGITPQAISTANGDETRTLQVYSAMVLEMGESVGVIPFILSNTSLEYDLSFRIRCMVTGSVPVVAIVNATGLDLNAQYSYLFPWITSSGMIPVELSAGQLSLLDQTESAVLLVIGSETLSSADVQAVDRWVMAGKPALFAVSSVAVDIGSTWQAASIGQNGLLQLLDYYGVQVSENLIAGPECFTLSLYSSATQSAPEYIPYPYWLSLDSSLGRNVQLFWPAGLTLYETEVCKATPVITAGENAVRVAAPFITNPFALQDGLTSAGAVLSGSAAGVPLAALLEGKLFSFYQGSYSQENRILVMGDQYFLSNMVENTGSGQNFSFLISSLLYLSGEEDVVAIKARWE